MIIATFEGKHNETKSKCLLLLFAYKKHNRTKGLSVSQIAAGTGLDYASLVTLLKRWSSFSTPYVLRKPGLNKQGRACFTYTISKRGVRFITERLPDDKHRQFVAELNQYRNGILAQGGELE